MEKTKEKSIILCGALRNNEKYIEKVFKNMYTIAKYFQSYKIVLYENDSTDNTKNILHKYMSEDQHVECCFESNVDNTYQYRTERLAYIRNKLLQRILEKYSHYDYLLIMDMDDVNSTMQIVETFPQIFE